MFQSNGTKFYAAFCEAETAKKLINQCKKLLIDFHLDGEFISDAWNLKNNVNNCNINGLLEKIEKIKKDLIKLDDSFKKDYFSAYENSIKTNSFDESSMDEMDQIQYSISVKEAERLTLYTLLEYESKDMLDDEMQEMLNYQKKLVELYDIEDKLSGMNPVSKEYIELYKEYSNCYINLIILNPNLSEEQKQAYLKDFHFNQYTETLRSVQDAYAQKTEIEKLEAEAKLKKEKLTKELNDLYKQRDDTDGILHPIKEKNIENKILELEKELGVKHKLDGFEKFQDKAGTAVVSFVEGFIDVGEGVVDGTIYGVAKSLQIFGLDDQWSEDIISYDFSSEMYDGIIDACDIDKEIAYGSFHSGGNFVGELGGYFAVSAIPYVGTALTIVGGAGKSVEENMNKQMQETGAVNDWEVFGYSALGALEGYGFGKAGKGIQTGINGLKKVGVKQAVKSIGGKLSTEGVKQTLKNTGKIALNATGQTLLDSDTYVETISVLGDDVITGLKTGKWDFERMAIETFATLGENYVGNLLGGVVNSKLTKKQDIEFDIKKKSMSNINDSKLDISDLSYERVGTVSSTYYMLESNVRKYSYVNTNTISGLNDSIKQNGLYHFSDSCDKILDSGYIKNSGYIASYGNKKSFFFNGVPDVGSYATNLGDLPLRTTAIKIMPDDDLLNSASLKVRHLDDQAITYDGNLKFTDGAATKEYFCLFKENDKLVYKNVSKEFFDNYPDTESGMLLNNFISKKSNVNTIKNDYYYNLSVKDENAISTTVSTSNFSKSMFESDSLVSSSELTSTGTSNLNLEDFKKYSLSDAEITGIGTSKKGLKEPYINPEVMKNLNPNELAVFGYDAKTGVWSSFDWTDYDAVMINRRCREIYLELDDELAIISASRIEAGENLEDIARDAVEQRNKNKIIARIDMNFKDRTIVELRNVAKYSPGLSVEQRKIFENMVESIYEESENTLKAMIGDIISEDMLHKNTMELMSKKTGIKIEDVYASSVGPSFEQLVTKKIDTLKKSGVLNPSMDKIYMELISDSSRANEELNTLLGLIQGGKK